MVTKTLTIMEDAYKLLLENKLENESFSETIRRILSKKEKKRKKLSDFFGIIDKETGESMIRDLERIRKKQMKFTKERLARLK